jgi:hypothetical protein
VWVAEGGVLQEAAGCTHLGLHKQKRQHWHCISSEMGQEGVGSLVRGWDSPCGRCL